MYKNILTLSMPGRMICRWGIYRQSKDSTSLCMGGSQRTQECQRCILLEQ